MYLTRKFLLQFVCASPECVMTSIRSASRWLFDPSQEFFNFCLREYRRRYLNRRVLGFQIDKRFSWELQLCSKRDMLRKLYLCDPQSKYRNMSTCVETAKKFKATLDVAAPVRTEALVGVEATTTSFAKQFFTAVATVWSMPTEHFNQMRLDQPSDGELALVDPAVTELQTFIEALEAIYPEDLRAKPWEQPHTFFVSLRHALMR